MLCLCFLFFFFKQKTAYELRISDWSSDVCSSDLFLLDRGKIVHAERLAALGCLDVIVKAIVGRRAEGDLRAGPQRLHRFGQDMGVVMASKFERIGLVARSDERQPSIAIEGAIEIAQFSVHARSP